MRLSSRITQAKYSKTSSVSLQMKKWNSDELAGLTKTIEHMI